MRRTQDIHPKFDDSGNYKMNEKHLMVFLHSDGFTERLLGFELYVTKSFEIEIYLRCFKKGNSYGGFETEIILNEIPEQISSFLNLISQIEQIDFGYKNDDYIFYEDMGSQEYLFNKDDKTVCFAISGIIPDKVENFKNDLGKKFFGLQKFLNEWMLEIYNDFGKNVS